MLDNTKTSKKNLGYYSQDYYSSNTGNLRDSRVSIDIVHYD